MRIGLYATMFFVLAASALGATIQGHIYYYDLSDLANVKIDINTTPHQIIIAQGGTYSIEVPTGTYIIEAKKYGIEEVIASTTDVIDVQSDGVFTLDLILFPTLADEEELLEEPMMVIDKLEMPEEKTSTLAYVLTIGIILAFGFILYYTWQARKTLKETEAPSEIDEIFNTEKKVYELIRKSGGRMTQKEIRKKIPLSEAKISLIISGLETDGKVEKLKIGRGNIIRIKN